MPGAETVQCLLGQRGDEGRHQQDRTEPGDDHAEGHEQAEHLHGRNRRQGQRGESHRGGQSGVEHGCEQVAHQFHESLFAVAVFLVAVEKLGDHVHVIEHGDGHNKDRDHGTHDVHGVAGDHQQAHGGCRGDHGIVHGRQDDHGRPEKEPHQQEDDHHGDGRGDGHLLEHLHTESVFGHRQTGDVVGQRLCFERCYPAGNDIAGKGRLHPKTFEPPLLCVGKLARRRFEQSQTSVRQACAHRLGGLLPDTFDGSLHPGVEVCGQALERFLAVLVKARRRFLDVQRDACGFFGVVLVEQALPFPDFRFRLPHFLLGFCRQKGPQTLHQKVVRLVPGSGRQAAQNLVQAADLRGKELGRVGDLLAQHIVDAVADVLGGERQVERHGLAILGDQGAA